MPRGGKPKVYAPEMVAEVQALYDAGHTQQEIAERLGSTQRVIWRLMQRHGIQARVAAKRDQRGENNAYWKGENATYAALHKRVEAARGTARVCDECATDDPDQSYDWANLTGNYADIEDYARMCRSCHRRYDSRRHKGGDVACS